MHFLVISIKQSSAFTSLNMYVIPTLIPYKGNISQLKIRFHDNDHLESKKGIIYMYHQKKRIKGGGSMKMFDHHHMMSENPEVDIFL